MSMTPDQMITLYHNERSEAKLGQQLFAIPRKNTDIIESQVFYYYVGDRRRVAVDFTKEICFHLNYLRVKSCSPAQYLRLQESTTPLEDLLAADLVYPFILFVSGIFIPWENITVICSKERYDLLVHGLPADYFDSINGADGIVENAYILDLPDGIEYYQGDYPITDKTMLAFDNKGKIVTSGDTAYITINDLEDYVQKIDFTNPQGVFRFADDPMYKYFPENFLTFVDGKYDPTIPVEVLATSAKLYDGAIPEAVANNLFVRIFHNTKLCTPTYDNIRKISVERNEEAIHKALMGETDMPSYMEYLKESFNPGYDITKDYLTNRTDFLDYLAKYDSMLFNRVYQSNKSVIDLEVDYMWVMGHKDENGMLKLPRRFQDGRNYYIMLLVNGELYEFYRNHYYQFGSFYCPVEGIKDGDTIELIYFKNAQNFELQATISKTQRYMPLDKWVYSDDLRIFCKETPDDYFKFPENGDQMFPVEYHYEYSDETKKKFRIRFENDFFYGKPVTLVSGKRFKYFLYTISDGPDGDNSNPAIENFNVILNGETYQFTNIGDFIIYKNMLDQLNDPSKVPPDFDVILADGTRAKFKFRGYDPENPNDVIIDMTTADVTIPLVYNPDTTEKKYFTINFGQALEYCNEYNRFVVFYNGKRLINDMYRLILPYRTTTPFTKAMIYLCIPIKAGDRLEIFYLPNYFTDIYDGLDPQNISDSGLITVDKEKLSFALDTELCSVWVNCHKLPPSYIANVDANHLQIVKDIHSMQDVRITIMMDKKDLYEEFATRFKDTTSLWDLACMNHDNPSYMMGLPQPAIDDTEPKAFPETIPITAIMHEIIRDWYVSNAMVDTTKPFLYDYLDVDESDIIGIDSGGNTLLGDMDSNVADSLDIDRPWP